MTTAFQYRPRFVDIRVRPPKPDPQSAPEEAALNPGERLCDHPGCRQAGVSRAPKSRELLNEHYWFCQPHAAEYNRSWNFYAGLTDDQIRASQEEESFTGGRPGRSKAEQGSPRSRRGRLPRLLPRRFRHLRPQPAGRRGR